eukprot:6617607-Prymnesium_polylepis.1
MAAADAAGSLETALLPGWNVLVYESPRELAAYIGGFSMHAHSDTVAAAARKRPVRPVSAHFLRRPYCITLHNGSCRSDGAELRGGRSGHSDPPLSRATAFTTSGQKN